MPVAPQIRRVDPPRTGEMGDHTSPVGVIEPPPRQQHHRRRPHLPRRQKSQTHPIDRNDLEITHPPQPRRPPSRPTWSSRRVKGLGGPNEQRLEAVEKPTSRCDRSPERAAPRSPLESDVIRGVSMPCDRECEKRIKGGRWALRATDRPWRSGGGGGNRTRVLQHHDRASPGAACFDFLSPGDHAGVSSTGSVTVRFPYRPRDRVDRFSLLAMPDPGRRRSRADKGLVLAQAARAMWP